MKAVILAAGKGTRLRELTNLKNKCSIKIGDKSIIKRIVDTFKLNNICNSYIVTGHGASIIESEIKEDATFLYNPLYGSAGILLSLWSAKDKVYGGEFVLSTGDNLINPKIFPEFLSTKGEVVVMVRKKQCVAYDVKVLVENNKIIKMEEDIDPKLSTGEFAMMIKFNSSTSQKLFDVTKTLLENEKTTNSRLIDVLNIMIKEGITFVPHYIDENDGIEIDTLEDLQEAEKIVKKFND